MSKIEIDFREGDAWIEKVLYSAESFPQRVLGPEKTLQIQRFLEAASLFGHIFSDQEQLFLNVLYCVFAAQGQEYGQVIAKFPELAYLAKKQLCVWDGRDRGWMIKTIEARSSLISRLRSKISGGCFTAINLFVAEDLRKRAEKINTDKKFEYERNRMFVYAAWHYLLAGEYVKSLAIFTYLRSSNKGDAVRAVTRSGAYCVALADAITLNEVFLRK
jgi:hypothetical protein